MPCLEVDPRQSAFRSRAKPCAPRRTFVTIQVTFRAAQPVTRDLWVKIRDKMAPMDWKTVLAHAHPVVVHFPIACLILALPLEWIALIRRAPAFGPAPRALLWTGLVIGGVAILSGLRLEDEVKGGLPDAALALLERHELAAFCTAGAAFLAIVTGELARRRPSRAKKAVYLVLVHLTAAAVGLTGTDGGRVVWGADWLPW